ncbi:MAG: hypothetical protein ACRCUJ_03230 [Phocaeicola sp.]
MTAIIILIAVLLLLNIVVILLYIASVKRLPPADDRDYYDENGNHIYYDRKLIRQLEKEKQNH